MCFSRHNKSQMSQTSSVKPVKENNYLKFQKTWSFSNKVSKITIQIESGTYRIQHSRMMGISDQMRKARGMVRPKVVIYFDLKNVITGFIF